MHRIAQVPQVERDALFREAMRLLGWRNVRIVEKDFWVCWTLDHLFRISGVREHLVFKGGTSLSKVHQLIERFSEDIDLCLDPAKLGFGEHTVVPYLAQALPELKTAPSGALIVLEVERTFWEKATILHNEYFRPETSGSAERISRHFYDLAMLANSPAGQRALAKTEWLERVIEHKQRFFKTGWSSFETARRGTFRLLPSDARRKVLHADYERMDEMFFTERPSFDAILETLGRLEQTLNS